MDAPPTEDVLDNRLADAQASSLKRDSWMEAPSAMDVDYVQRRKEPEPDKTKATKKDYDLKIHDKELNQHLRDLQEGKEDTSVIEEPAQHEVSYTFGDNGSQWRMTKLKNVYREAKESGRPVDDIALERFGSFRDFDDAREEETELERRATYGKDYVGKEKPSGELYQERKMKAGVRRDSIPSRNEVPELPQGQIVQEKPPPAQAAVMDATSLNRLRAKMMKAKLKGGPEAEKLEAEYNSAMAGAANRKEPEVVVLGAMENRMLASRKGEVKDIDNKRGRERGLVEENEDMSIEDMVRQERRTRGQQGGEGYRLAETIAKDAKFDNDLDYMDENAGKLAKHVQKSNINLRNTAISDFQKMNRILDSCPLCHHEDTNTPPVAPVVSLATRVYLTLPTEPEISEGGACIIPIQHRINLLECDDDEWEEIRVSHKAPETTTRTYTDLPHLELHEMPHPHVPRPRPRRRLLRERRVAAPQAPRRAQRRAHPLRPGRDGAGLLPRGHPLGRRGVDPAHEADRHGKEVARGHGPHGFPPQHREGDALLPRLVRARRRHGPHRRGREQVAEG